MENKNQPAFPIVEDNVVEGQAFQEVHYFGLSKREYFAGLAMQGLLAASGDDTITTKAIFESLELPADTKYEYPKHYAMYLAKCSIIAADELLNQISQ